MSRACCTRLGLVRLPLISSRPALLNTASANFWRCQRPSKADDSPGYGCLPSLSDHLAHALGLKAGRAFFEG
jgi:hypothetical protein